jgi:methyl-accepting chemotaxis protein
MIGTHERVLQPMGPTCKELEKNLRTLEAHTKGWLGTLHTAQEAMEASVQQVVEAKFGQIAAHIGNIDHRVQQVGQGMSSTVHQTTESIGKITKDLTLDSNCLQEVIDRLEAMEEELKALRERPTPPAPPTQPSVLGQRAAGEGGHLRVKTS